jgi:hypothetical protein
MATKASSRGVAETSRAVTGRVIPVDTQLRFLHLDPARTAPVTSTTGPDSEVRDSPTRGSTSTLPRNVERFRST